MIRVYIEPSGESPPLARAEAVAAAGALGGAEAPESSEFEGLLALDLPDERTPPFLAGRLALAHRCLVRLDLGDDVGEAAASAGTRADAAAFRRLGQPTAGDDPAIHAAARRFKSAGGRIDLDHPSRRFWLARDRGGADHLLEEVATVDRPSADLRRMPLLPFQRPVSLPPRLARAAANLARVRPGDRVLDPFLGTGALLAEAGLLGGRLYGIDRDATMVRGAVENLAFLGVSAQELLVGDAGEVEFPGAPAEFDAILTDPPYGRSSSTGGEACDRLVERVVPRWADRLRPTARVVLIVPTGAAELPTPWRVQSATPVRVHRSLTREFRVYVRA
ncbi:MAG: RsmD family RNA methyltransferase [Thermoplasmata archaeon]|jgi:tRNA (guanine10-N2)-dimethyltransferase